MQAPDENAYREAIFMLVLGNSGMLNDEIHDHEFQWGTDGDGWNEPESDWAECHCQKWQHPGWVQIDPERTGRPDPVDMVLEWRDHIIKDVWRIEDGDIPQDSDSF